MRRFALVLAVVLASVAQVEAAPPSVPPELVAWWDAWHTNPSTPFVLTVPMERSLSTGKIIWYSNLPYAAQCRSELATVRDNPGTSPVARQQANAILSHWGMWPKRTGAIIDVP